MSINSRPEPLGPLGPLGPPDPEGAFWVGLDAAGDVTDGALVGLEVGVAGAFGEDAAGAAPTGADCCGAGAAVTAMVPAEPLHVPPAASWMVRVGWKVPAPYE